MPQRIFLTGCSTGVGHAAAKLLAGAGHQIVATVRNDADAAALTKATGGALQALLMEVTDEDSVRHAVAEALRGGPIDIAINNIGMPCIGAAEELAIDTLKHAMDVNFYGALRVCQAVIPGMRQQGRGLIINISSSIGAAALPLYGGYCATKFALEAASEAMLLELAPFGISVKILRPGIILTPFVEKKQDQAPSHLPPNSAYAGRLDNPSPDNLMAHVSRPEEVVEALLQLIQSENAPFRTETGADSQHWCDARRRMDDKAFFARLAGEGYGFGLS